MTTSTRSSSESASECSLLAGDLLLRPQRVSWLNRLPVQGMPLPARPRHTIYRAHEALDGVPLIVDGWAARVIRFSDGRRQILSFVLPGDLISTSAVFAGSFGFFVEAITAVRYISYAREEFNGFLASDPELAGALLSACLAEKDEADRLAANLGRRRAEERIASLFLHLRDRLQVCGLVRDERFACPLRQKHIADATGLTPVHVNRVLGTLRQSGLVDLADGELTIADLPGLRQLADMR